MIIMLEGKNYSFSYGVLLSNHEENDQIEPPHYCSFGTFLLLLLDKESTDLKVLESWNKFKSKDSLSMRWKQENQNHAFVLDVWLKKSIRNIQ